MEFAQWNAGLDGQQPAKLLLQFDFIAI